MRLELVMEMHNGAFLRVGDQLFHGTPQIDRRRWRADSPTSVGSAIIGGVVRRDRRRALILVPTTAFFPISIASVLFPSLFPSEHFLLHVH